MCRLLYTPLIYHMVPSHKHKHVLMIILSVTAKLYDNLPLSCTFDYPTWIPPEWQIIFQMFNRSNNWQNLKKKKKRPFTKMFWMSAFTPATHTGLRSKLEKMGNHLGTCQQNQGDVGLVTMLWTCQVSSVWVPILKHLNLICRGIHMSHWFLTKAVGASENQAFRARSIIQNLDSQNSCSAAILP